MIFHLHCFTHFVGEQLPRKIAPQVLVAVLEAYVYVCCCYLYIAGVASLQMGGAPSHCMAVDLLCCAQIDYWNNLCCWANKPCSPGLACSIAAKLD